LKPPIGMEDRRWSLIAPPVVLAFPFINLLIYHQYGFWHPEVGLLFLGILAIGLILGLVNLGSKPLTPLLISCWVTIALLFQLDLTLWQLLALLLTLCVVGSLLHHRFSTIVVVIFVAMPITGWFAGNGNIVENNKVKPTDLDLPIYIHLIFDGHIGIEGVPQEVVGGQALKEDTQAFFDEHGFSVYEKAYSHYVATISSLKNLFDFNNADVNHFTAIQSGFEYNLGKTKYFQVLRQQGYALRVLHPNQIDYCSANWKDISFCYRYPDLNLQSISGSGYSIIEKIGLMAQMLIKQTRHFEEYYEIMRKTYSLPELTVKKIPANNGRMVRQITEDIKQHLKGYAYILHFLTPHPPLVYDAECVLQTERPIEETQVRDSNVDAVLVDGKMVVRKGSNTPQSRALRYSHYFSQVRCGLMWLAQIIETLKKADVYDDAVILVHGDHGSKIDLLTPFSTWIDQLKNDDYIDTYSALFAVKQSSKRLPQDTFLSLEEILADIVEHEFKEELDVSKSLPFVYLQSIDPSAALGKMSVQGFLSPLAETEQKVLKMELHFRTEGNVSQAIETRLTD